MSKSEDEKAALQAGSGGAGLPSLAGEAGGGIRVPSDFFDKLTTEITPQELSSLPADIKEAYSDAPRIDAVGKRPSMSDRFGPGGVTTLTGGDFSVGPDFGNLGIGMGDIGNFDPMAGTSPTLFTEKQKTFGQKAKETIIGFLKRLARVHPATRNAAFAYDFVTGLQDAENPQEFVKDLVTDLSLRKIGSNLGISPLQRQGISLGLAANRGEITPGQGIGSLATSAAFRAAGPSLFRSAYDKGGMNAVYGVATLLGMAQNAAQRRIFQPGPGGDG